MDLTPEQQERYSRHLLLEGLGGEGQERLCAARVRLIGEGPALRWARLYLEASGVQVGESDTSIIVEARGGAIDGAQAALAAVVRIAKGEA